MNQEGQILKTKKIFYIRRARDTSILPFHLNTLRKRKQMPRTCQWTAKTIQRGKRLKGKEKEIPTGLLENVEKEILSAVRQKQHEEYFTSLPPTSTTRRNSFVSFLQLYSCFFFPNKPPFFGTRTIQYITNAPTMLNIMYPHTMPKFLHRSL